MKADDKIIYVISAYTLADSDNMAGMVKWLTRRIVAPLRVGSSPTTRPIFFCLKSDIVGLHGGIAKR